MTVRKTTAAAFLLLATTPAFAGMPSLDLTDVAKARLDVISFFIFVYLLCALIFRWLWNLLSKDFAWMPRLTFRRSLALLIVAGLFLYFILTMISGARELMTPGAWAKNGITYKLRTPDRDPQPWLDAARQRWLETLRDALRDYAAKHDGKLPPHAYVTDFNATLWKGASPDGHWLIYIPGLTFGPANRVLVYEPATYGPKRWALLTDGTVVQMNAEELDERVRKEFGP
ncbi:hypothetical protein [Prosthecobacter sp.]|uniref:hypothetical protein n=1 Tax=Prosthecobacter sp. TaxID=1965333 RepID=UPI00378332C5